MPEHSETQEKLDNILVVNICEKNRLIELWEKSIAKAKLDITAAKKEIVLFLAQLNNSPRINEMVPTAKEPIQKKRPRDPNKQKNHRERLKRHILDCLKEHAECNRFLKNRGLRISEIRHLIIEKEKTIKCSPNTISYLVDELILASLVICINADQEEQKLFKITK